MIKNLAAKLRKIIQLTKKMLKKMKKSMFIFNVVITASLAVVAVSYTIGSLIKAGWHNWHVGMIAICLLAISLVKDSVRELKQQCNDEK